MKKKKNEKVYVGLWYGCGKILNSFDTIVITFKIIYPIKC